MKIEIKQHGKPTVRFEIPNKARNSILTLFEYIETFVTEGSSK